MITFPKHITMFWHDRGNEPLFVSRCYENVRRLHPPTEGWTVELLSDADLPSPTDRPMRRCVQQMEGTGTHRCASIGFTTPC